MNESTLYIILFLTGVFVSSVSQILLKKSAGRKYKNKLREYLNPLVAASYCMFFGATLFAIFAYKKIPLTLGPVLECAAYIFIPVLSGIFLKEKFTKRKSVKL